MHTSALPYFIFFCIFFGKRPDCDLPFLKEPLFVVLGFRLSLAGQPLLVLQAGATRLNAATNSREKMKMTFLRIKNQNLNEFKLNVLLEFTIW